MQWRFEDLRCSVAVGNGDLHLLKQTKHCALYSFDAHNDAGTAASGDLPFLANCIVLTVDGTWSVRAHHALARVDCTAAVVAEAGHLCARGAVAGNVQRLLLALDPTGLDDDVALFRKAVINAGDLPRFARMAQAASCDDAFETLLYTAFDHASTASLGRRQRDSRIRMQRLKRFIEYHAFEPIRLQDMSKEMSLSPFAMVRMFRAATGTSPYAYLLELRFERACALLRQGTRSIASVAHDTGFEQHPHFTRWFTSRAGVAPSVYRTQHLSQTGAA